jgi:hypothetical protein
LAETKYGYGQRPESGVIEAAQNSRHRAEIYATFVDVDHRQERGREDEKPATEGCELRARLATQSDDPSGGKRIIGLRVDRFEDLLGADAEKAQKHAIGEILFTKHILAVNQVVAAVSRHATRFID